MPDSSTDKVLNGITASCQGSLNLQDEKYATRELSGAIEGFTSEAVALSGRSLLKSPRGRASHHGRADMLAMHNSTPTNDTQSGSAVTSPPGFQL